LYPVKQWELTLLDFIAQFATINICDNQPAQYSRRVITLQWLPSIGCCPALKESVIEFRLI
jgi:hypothetical protein